MRSAGIGQRGDDPRPVTVRGGRPTSAYRLGQAGVISGDRIEHAAVALPEAVEDMAARGKP
jgi:hypothetical protein